VQGYFSNAAISYLPLKPISLTIVLGIINLTGYVAPTGLAASNGKLTNTNVIFFFKSESKN
jgi:hypothetical protein